MIRWLLGIVFCLLVIIGVLPTILGSRWIYQPLLDQLAADDFRLSIEGVRLRWFSPLQLDGIQLSENQGPALLHIRQVKTDRSLFGYLIGGRKLGRLEIIEPTASVELLRDGTNLDRLAQAIERTRQNPTRGDKTPPAVDLDVIVRGLSAKVLNNQASQTLVVIPPFDVVAHYQAAAQDTTAQSARLIVEPTQVLHEVQITKELIDLGLGHAVPLLAQSAWFDGRVSLSVGRIEVPLATPELAGGSMQLTLHQVRSGPNHPAITGLIDFVGRLRQREPAHELVFVDGSVIDVSLSSGRVTHDGLQFGLPKMDSRFQISTRGSVGLQDKSLDLLISIPVPIEQLARRDEVRKLGVPTLQLPIKGTLDEPKLDWQSMRGDAAALLGSIRQAVGDDAPAAASVIGTLESLADGQADQAIGAAVDVIQQLRQRRREKETQSQAEPVPADQQSDPQPEKRPIRDALRDLLRGQ